MARSFAHLRIAGPVAVPLLPSPLHVRRKARYRPAWLAWSDRIRTRKMTLPYFLKDSHLPFLTDQPFLVALGPYFSVAP